MEHLAPLLNKLAEQLGTTSQYLWSVLLKQAPVQASIMGFEYATTILLLFLLFKFRAAAGAFYEKCHEDYEILTFICTIVLGLVAVIWLLACLFCVESFFTAIFNPEYWALKQVLRVVQK